MKKNSFVIRIVQEKDISPLASIFLFPWTTAHQSMAKWQRYFSEQTQGIRNVYIAFLDDEPIGYGTLLKVSAYPNFKDNNIPELNDLWIAPSQRNAGFGRKLIEHIEDIARHEGYTKIGLSVGLYKDYGAAQRLYTSIGYVLDGMGATYNNISVIPGTTYRMDDELLIWLTKSL